MIIFGFRVIFRTISSGMFLCPQEGGDRPFKLRVAQRFFTLFFIPLIPLKKMGRVVECDSCKARFEEGVLNRATVAQQTSALTEAVRGAAVSVLRAGAQTPSRLGREQALRMVTNYVSSYNDEALSADLAQFNASALQMQLHALAGTLDPTSKEGILTRLTLVALADKGGVTPNERYVLEHVGADLGMTLAHCRGTIDSVIDQATKR
jgi:hypothetical protein